MIGTNILLHTGSMPSSPMHLPPKEPWHRQALLCRTPGAEISCTTYDGYPLRHWEHLDHLMVVEGCVYNLSDADLTARLEAIADAGPDFAVLVSRFVREADGDYVVTLFNRVTERCLIFNDLLGGIPMHYGFHSRCFAASRSLSQVVHCMPQPVLEQFSGAHLAEYLTLSYNVGSRTLFKDVFKMEPAQCIVCTCQGDTLHVTVSDTVRPDFALHQPYRHAGEAADDLARLFLEGCRSRIAYAREHGYRIVNTMSGGCDSRTVLGGIERFETDYLNLTYEYLQDESTVARRVLEHVQSRSRYLKLQFHNEPDLFDAGLTGRTDGKVNCYTNSICYNDMQEVRRLLPQDKPVMLFGGFGGEYIRHPLFPFAVPYRWWGMCYKPSMALSARVFGLDGKTVNRQFADALQRRSPRSREETAKYLYNEYYQNLVRSAGEDRTRMFFFTVQPMMSKDFILAIRNRVPLRWVGFGFFRKFMDRIDPRLAEVELYGTTLNLQSRCSLYKKDLLQKQRLTSAVRCMQRLLTKVEYRPQPVAVPFDRFEAILITRLTNASTYKQHKRGWPGNSGQPLSYWLSVKPFGPEPSTTDHPAADRPGSRLMFANGCQHHVERIVVVRHEVL